MHEIQTIQIIGARKKCHSKHSFIYNLSDLLPLLVLIFIHSISRCTFTFINTDLYALLLYFVHFSCFQSLICIHVFDKEVFPWIWNVYHRYYLIYAHVFSQFLVDNDLDDLIYLLLDKIEEMLLRNGVELSTTW